MGTALYIGKRLILGLGVIWVITLAVFLVFYVAPGDVARLIAGAEASPQVLDVIRQNLGLDEPLIVQYLSFLGSLLRGDLGFSYYTGLPVTEIISSRLPVSVSLTIGAAIIWLAIGIPAGLVAATKRHSVTDRVVTIGSLVFHSTPTFLLGLVLVYFLYFQLTLAGIPLFPAGGYVPLTDDPLKWAHHLVLPWLTVALVLAATYTRLTRASMVEVLGEDYIRTARSKGLTDRRVNVRHGLRSALTPIVTQLGIDIGALVGGVIITETVFGLPGLGRAAIDAVQNRDLPVVIGVVLVASVAIVVINILVDAVYALLDPRVRLD